MSIDSISSSSIYVPPASLTQSTQTTSDSDGDSGKSVKGSGGHHHHHGGGQVQNALMQALQSLGLTSAQSSSTTSASSSTQTQSGTGTDTDGSTSATDSVKNDVGQFMHALFQAVKGEDTSSSSSNSSSDPKANFASGLSALISQVTSGNAPSALQSAFSKLTSDLQANSSTSSNGGTTASQATLQALLGQMQQNLGYGAVSNNASIGNIVNQQG